MDNHKSKYLKSHLMIRHLREIKIIIRYTTEVHECSAVKLDLY